MNERIRELSDIAYKNHLAKNPHSSFGRRSDYDLEFAELIVKECCLQVADVRIENDFEPVGDAALVQALTGIRRYFGVEE
jgi:hypothetical protein